ncbi:hypothetical protein GCM10010249_37230 [Streptomyces roseolilacinus]|uniref:Uncharacterized protein n=1 Tax=Streptomyces roseolilacinus TaxID=66904 RepID=A0A918B2C0_9ACTN|nr:hypothetical protein GCM10010249_37230 [Streptomyces roseolilacinus]
MVLGRWSGFSGSGSNVRFPRVGMITLVIGPGGSEAVTAPPRALFTAVFPARDGRVG